MEGASETGPTKTEGNLQPTENLKIENKFQLPVIILGTDVPQSTVDAVQHAAITTLDQLNIPLDNLRNVDVHKMIDLTSKDENGFYTFKRLPESDMQIPVLVISSNPLYDEKGKETIALYEPENAKIFLNLRRLSDHFQPNFNLDTGTKAGIIVVEEIIHFVQDKYWKRDWSGGTTDFQDEEFATEHDSDPIEKEALKLKKQVFDVLYPELNIKVRGVDY